MAQFWWICLGGAAGTAARYLLSTWAARALGTGFPYGTVAVNLIGSFVIVVLMHPGLSRGMLAPTARIALVTGVMGGFTTYSSFNYETFRSLQQGAYLTAGLNAAVTLVGCLGAAALGQFCATALFGSGAP
jgi:CrcB protein